MKWACGSNALGSNNLRYNLGNVRKIVNQFIIINRKLNLIKGTYCETEILGNWATALSGNMKVICLIDISWQ